MKHLISLILVSLSSLASPPLHAETKPAKLVAGDTPPTFVGRELGGSDIQLDLAGGKAYVVTFWASWCSPCLKELPVLARVQELAGKDKLQVIAVNIEDRDAYRRVQRHIRDAGLTSTFDPDKKAQGAFGVGGIPHMVIIGRDGRVTTVRVGYTASPEVHQSLADDLNRALATTP